MYRLEKIYATETRIDTLIRSSVAYSWQGAENPENFNLIAIDDALLIIQFIRCSVQFIHVAHEFPSQRK